MSNPVTIHRILDASVERVWKALTDLEQMKQWYFELDAFEPQKGFQFSFYGQGTKGEQYLHECEVLEVLPLQKISYSWTYKGFEGYSVVSFELESAGEKTKITVTHSGLDSFPANNPDFAAENFNMGWTELIGKLLPDFLKRTV